MAPSQTKSEHWLTLMCCANCKQTPDESPVYMCSLGHTFCLKCFKVLTRIGVPKCSQCNSTKFTAKTVSEDFLKKLKTRPGIGRPCRYVRVDSNLPTPNVSAIELKNQDDTVTVEKLFQMPTEQLRKYFDDTSKVRTKLTTLHPRSNYPGKNLNASKSATRPWSVSANKFQCVPARKEPSPGTSHLKISNASSPTNINSRKPVTCPHDACGKIIAMSYFQSHFKHEHSDIPKLSIDRGDQLQVNLNSAYFEFNRTACLAMVTVHDKSAFNAKTYPRGHSANVARMFPEKVIIGTYWLMMSGSQETKRTHAYVLFWLFTNETRDQATNVNCTLEIASQRDEMAFSSFCSINLVPDVMTVSAVAQRLQCLHVSYGGIESLLTYGPRPIFRLTIH